MTPNLAATIEDAYRVFAGYTITDSLVVCHCNVCMTEETERRLVATPLRQLPSHLLAEYTNSAHGYDDGQIAHELRYLLPRYLELIAVDDAPDHLGLDTCLRRLGEARWREIWPDTEAAVISRFFDALAADRLARIEPVECRSGWYLRFDIAEILTLVVTAGGDIHRLLNLWDATEDPQAALWMAAQRRSLLWLERPYFYNGTLRTDRNAEFREAAYTIGAFLARPEVEARIEAAFFAVEHPGLQEILSTGLG